MNHKQRRFVIGMHREHGTDHAEPVCLLRETRHEIRNPHAGLAMLRKLERAAHQAAGLLRSGKVGGDLIEIGFAVMFVEHRFGIEKIHLARPAVHEEVNHRFRLGREVGRARLQIVHAAVAFGQSVG